MVDGATNAAVAVSSSEKSKYRAIATTLMMRVSRRLAARALLSQSPPFRPL